MLLVPESGWRIEDVARSTGTSLDGAAPSHLAQWLDTLATWNARMDLTAAKTADEAAELMLTDAFVVSNRLPVGASVVDVGTGAGAPGLAIALLRPDLKVTLVEPLGKRVSFLRTVTGLLHRTDVAVIAARGDAATKGAFDVAISRATLEPSEWLALGGTLVPSGGSIWVLVSSRDAAPSGSAKESIDYELPFSGKHRVAMRFEKA